MQQQLLQLVVGQFGLEVVETRSPLVSPQPQPILADRLLARLEGSTEYIFPDTNERTRAEMIVAPIVFYLAVACDLSLYSGNPFNADIKGGLSGTVDHLLSRAMPPRSTIPPPIAAVVETKSRERGVSHCLVQMIAAQRVNACPDPVYGVVTTGLLWQFLKLEGRTVTIDLNQYPLFSTQPSPSSLVPMDMDEPPAPIVPLLSLLLSLLKGSGSEDSPGS